MDEEEAVNEANALGIIVVAAAGWKSTGTAFPAKLRSVISVGSSLCDGTLAPFSPTGKELDCVACGSVRLGSDCMVGTGVSTIILATDLALLFQKLFCNNGALIRNTCVDTYVIRELFELVAGGGVATSHYLKKVLDLPSCTVLRNVKHMLWMRDRRAISSYPLSMDASSNTKIWSSEAINIQCQNQLKGFPHLTGTHITIAIIDTFKNAFLSHLKSHNVEVLWKTENIRYFSFNAALLLNACCTKHVLRAGGHGLQCAAIIANTAPNCNVLMVMHHDNDTGEKVALGLVMEKNPDIHLSPQIPLIMTPYTI